MAYKDFLEAEFERARLALPWLGPDGAGGGAGDPRNDLPPESIDANVARDTFEQLLASVGKPVIVLFPVFAAAAHLADCYVGCEVGGCPRVMLGWRGAARGAGFSARVA